MALGKGSRINNITGRPRALSRYHSLTAFNASTNTPFYSPFQFAAQVVGKQFGKSAAFREAVYGSKTAVPEEQIFQRGIMSMITAGRKADLIERRAIAGSGRATKKVAKAQDQVRRLALMNNPSMAKANLGARFLGAENAARLSQMTLPAGMQMSTTAKGSAYITGGSFIDRSIVGMSGAPSAGLTGNLMASAGASQASRFTQGYFRGALGYANAGGLQDDALRGAQKAVSHLAGALGQQGLNRSGTTVATKALEQGVFKTLGVNRTLQALGTKQGAMVLGARTAAMAIPGLNLLATASLVYDLGKMGGEVVKSGINLTRDAVKSMKGSIDKPVFGMGYKDNEVAATSRSRGVMAIQNSRLNARSMLGSEGAMMAAHFG
jgi:hypothetical protein